MNNLDFFLRAADQQLHLMEMLLFFKTFYLDMQIQSQIPKIKQKTLYQTI